MGPRMKKKTDRSGIEPYPSREFSEEVLSKLDNQLHHALFQRARKVMVSGSGEPLILHLSSKKQCNGSLLSFKNPSCVPDWWE